MAAVIAVAFLKDKTLAEAMEEVLLLSIVIAKLWHRYCCQAKRARPAICPIGDLPLLLERAQKILPRVKLTWAELEAIARETLKILPRIKRRATWHPKLHTNFHVHFLLIKLPVSNKTERVQKLFPRINQTALLQAKWSSFGANFCWQATEYLNMLVKKAETKVEVKWPLVVLD